MQKVKSLEFFLILHIEVPYVLLLVPTGIFLCIDYYVIETIFVR